jgi:hypothetical protein
MPSIETVEPPRRRCFRFNLRTLLVLVTVACVWLAYSVNWIGERRSFREAKSVHPFYSACDAGTPGLLWLFGEREVVLLYLAHPTKEVIVEAERLFPEAQILDAVDDPYFPAAYSTVPPAD